MSKGVKIIVSFLLLLLFVLPNSLAWAPWEAKTVGKEWVDLYVLESLELCILYIPYLIVWILLMLITNPNIKKILYGSFIIFSFFLFMLSAGSFMILAQDFIPSYGVYISCLFFPILLADWVYQRYLLGLS